MAHLISPNRHAQIQPFGVVFVALHDRQLRASQIGAGQVRAAQIGTCQPCGTQVDSYQACGTQVRVRQVAPAQVGAREIRAAEVRARQVASAQIGPSVAGHSTVAGARDRRQCRGGVRLAFAQKRGVVSHRHADGQRLDNRLRQLLVVWHEGVNVVDQAEPPTGDARAIVEVRTCGGLGHFSTSLCGGTYTHSLYRAGRVSRPYRGLSAGSGVRRHGGL